DLFLRRVAARRGITTWTVPAKRTRPDRRPTEPVARDPALALRVRGLDVEYDGVQVLFGVDLDVGDGQTVAVLGTNGPGKSTLLRAVSGIVRARHGSITIAGRDTTRRAPERIAAMGVSHAPGGEGVFPSLTVAEHMRLARWRQRDRRVTDDA